MKLLKKISQIIAKINLSNKDKGHSSDSMPPMIIAKEKEAKEKEEEKPEQKKENKHLRILDWRQ